MTKAADKIIVALDVATKEKALDLVEELRDQISFFKIGLQLYTAEGPEIVRAVLSAGAKVWLDIKLHDIPNTIARAVESATNLGVQMLTIHLSGGSEMVRAATAAGGVYRVDECGHCDAPGHAVRAYQNMIKTVRSVAAQMRAAGAR